MLTRPEAASRPLPRPSARAQRAELAFAWERFSDCITEAQPLLRRHWHEIALDQDKSPLDPDWDMYFALDRMGRIALLTVRDEGRLVGYLQYLVNPRLHNRQTVEAVSDVFWLDPSYREGSTGIRMFKLAEAALRQRGVHLLTNRQKCHYENNRVAKLFQHLGFEKREESWTKWIGE